MCVGCVYMWMWPRRGISVHTDGDGAGKIPYLLLQRDGSAACQQLAGPLWDKQGSRLEHHTADSTQARASQHQITAPTCHLKFTPANARRSLSAPLRRGALTASIWLFQMLAIRCCLIRSPTPQTVALSSLCVGICCSQEVVFLFS